MRKYVSEDRKALRKSSRIVAIIAGFGMIGLAIVAHSWRAGLIGVVLLLAMAMQKEIAMTENGLEVTYDMMVYKYKEVWTFDEIKEIHKELSPDGKKMALHVMKDVMSRKLIYSIPESRLVLELALEKNPKIHIGNAND